MSRPDFFIVGAPKCGTTSLAAWLGQHPEIFVIRGEPHFFGSDLDYNRPRLRAAQYRALCGARGGKRLCGDRSTWYLYSAKAAGEIARWNPDARIIALLRHPAEIIHSLHAHHVQRGERDDIVDLNAALAAEPERRAGRRIPPNVRFAASLFYSAIPRYSEQLARYFEHFGRERVRVVLLDDLRADPRAVWSDTLDFLGADPEFLPDFGIENVSAPTSKSWLYRHWKASTWRYRLRSRAPENVYRVIRRWRKQRLARAAERAPRAPLDSALRARLVEQFRTEIERLEVLLERDLSAWKS
ncbi:MAG: hypothetical protein RQ729_09800 [Wenzhouxiangellaceae bacterium]|nr:hypothetical protein [Wenzhouxiangellaceae bacterium]